MQTIDLTEDAVRELERNGLKRGSIIRPDYSRLNLANIGATILKFLGLETNVSPPLHELNPFKGALDDVFKSEPKKLLVILINSIDLGLLGRLLGNTCNLCENILKGVVSSTFPSVTPTALMTLYTGLPPLAHGVLGFEFYYEKLRKIVNPFKMNMSLDKRFIKDIFVVHNNLFKEALKGGISPIAFMPCELSSNQITYQMLSGAEIHGYRSLIELSNLIKDSGKSQLLYVYFSKLDESIHRNGGSAPSTLNVLYELEKFINSSLRRGFRMVLLSDHSYIDVHRVVNIERIPSFEVAVNGGRVVYVYGFNSLEVEYKALKSFSREKMVTEGWFGVGEFSERIGQILIVAEDKNYITYGEKKSNEKATHGGFLADEMLAPFAILSPSKE